MKPDLFIYFCNLFIVETLWVQGEALQPILHRTQKQLVCVPHAHDR